MRLQLILIGLLAAFSLNAQNYLIADKTLKDGTQVIEAPRFGSPDYFRTHFVAPAQPKVELIVPARLQEFVVDGHLELSLRQYLELVLANSPDIAVQKLSLETPKNAITRALARFDPSVTTSFSATRSASPNISTLEAREVVSRLNQPLRFTYTQMLDTGTSYSAGFTGSRTTTNSSTASVNPSLDSGMSFSVTQPLLRNFGREVNRLSVLVAQSNLQRSRYTLQNTLLRLIATAENAYWAVIEARESLRVAEENLKLNEALLERSTRELELGAISHLDIYQPQQNRALAEIRVSQMRYQLAQRLDALRRQIGADIDPKFQEMPINLTEEVMPPENEAPLNAAELVEVALKTRPDLRASLQSEYSDELNWRSAKNNLRPNLSLSLNYSTSGVGGIQYIRDREGNLIETIPGGLGDALNQVWGFDYPTYGFSLSLQLPIRDRSAVAALADAAVSKKTTALNLQILRQDIRLAVLNAVSQVESSKAQVDLAKTQLDFSQLRLDAEQQRYDLGISTIYLLIQAQNDLSSAQSNLVTQSSAYRRNMTNLLQTLGTLLGERGIVIQ